jgi:hypothetical protein
MSAKPVEYHQGAIADVKNAVAWYQKRSPKAALDFIEEEEDYFLGPSHQMQSKSALKHKYRSLQCHGHLGFAKMGFR